MSKNLWIKRIRNYAGLLGMILPWLCFIGYRLALLNYGDLVNPSGFFPDSMSITYYLSPILAMVLTTASIVLMCYDGYNLRDNLVTTISGVFGILIVLFPCNPSHALDVEYLRLYNVGFFQIPYMITAPIHNISALVFFVLLAYNSFFLFTLSDGAPTKMKKIRNIIYRVCAIGMVFPMIFALLPISFPSKTWWIEMVALTFFGISWLVKGEAFKFLNDK